MSNAIELSAKDEALLRSLATKCESAAGAELLSVVLYGEAASAGYRPGVTPLSSVVVFEQTSPAALEALRSALPRFGRGRLPAPLMMDPAYIASSQDVFPLEFLEIQDHRKLIHGKTDPFEGIEIHREHLRLEVEEQDHGKLLQLREAYLDSAGSSGRLRRLMLESIVGFEVILRGMVFLASLDRPDHPERLLESVEAGFEIQLPIMHRLRQARGGGAPLRRAELSALFTAYLEETSLLAATVDGL